jgi:hypothetical protein
MAKVSEVMKADVQMFEKEGIDYKKLRAAYEFYRESPDGQHDYIAKLAIQTMLCNFVWCGKGEEWSR